MSDQKIIVDISCGGYRDPKTNKVVSWLSSNIEHMYDVKKDLLARAPGFVGHPRGNFYGAGFIEGTVQELRDFFALFVAEYDDESTVREVASILEAVDRGETLIRCYRIVWPDRYDAPFDDSQTFARFCQVMQAENRGAGWGHMVCARDAFRLHCTHEVMDAVWTKTGITVDFLNGWVETWTYREIGFEWAGQEVPLAHDWEQAWQLVQKIAGRYDEKLAWFEQEIKNDPRYGEQSE